MPVENTMPTIVTVPITWRATPPAPSAFQSGASPRMNANDVMRIGRNRRRAASSTLSRTLFPDSCSLTANSTIRIGFLAERTMIVIRKILKKK